MDEFSHITQLLHASRPEEAISVARDVLKRKSLTQADKAEAYYLMGNAYRQLNDFKEAMNCYCEAMELDPHSPAAMAYEAAQEVMGFYDHDLYNP